MSGKDACRKLLPDKKIEIQLEQVFIGLTQVLLFMTKSINVSSCSISPLLFQTAAHNRATSPVPYQIIDYNRPRSIYQYSNWLRGFQDKLLHLLLFSLYSSLFWELRDKRNFKKFQF